MKSGGRFFPQEIRAWSVRGMMILRLRSLILIVVQRQTAASSSSSPPITGQQVFTTGFPTPACTNPPRTSTHNPNFSVSTGHFGEEKNGLVLGTLLDGGGFITGGIVTGGLITGGVITGGAMMTGGTTTGGFLEGVDDLGGLL